MHHLKAALAAVLLVCAASAAQAVDVSATVTRKPASSCVTMELCSGASVPGVCANAGGDIVGNFAGQYVTSLYATRSTATTFTCDLVTSDVTNATAGDTPQTIKDSDGTALLTQAKRFNAISAPLAFGWINCSAIDGGGDTVVVTAQVCPLVTD